MMALEKENSSESLRFSFCSCFMCLTSFFLCTTLYGLSVMKKKNLKCKVPLASRADKNEMKYKFFIIKMTKDLLFSLW